MVVFVVSSSISLFRLWKFLFPFDYKLYFFLFPTLGTFYPGMKVNALDLSPNYSGTLMALVNGIGAFTGILTPYIVSELTPNQTLAQWRLVFWIVFVVFVLTNLIFVLYANGEVQYWNDPEFVRREREERRMKIANEKGEVGKTKERLKIFST